MIFPLVPAVPLAAIHCPLPVYPSSLVPVGPANTSLGAVVRFECAPGYMGPTGPGTDGTRCLPNATWTHLPLCTRESTGWFFYYYFYSTFLNSTASKTSALRRRSSGMSALNNLTIDKGHWGGFQAQPLLIMIVRSINYAYDERLYFALLDFFSQTDKESWNLSIYMDIHIFLLRYLYSCIFNSFLRKSDFLFRS